MSMHRILWVIGVLIVTLALLPVGGFAQQEHGGKEHGGSATPAAGKEHGGKEHGGTTATRAAATPVEPASTDSASPTVQATPPVAPPALKPIVITFSGNLATVDANAAPAMITVQDRYGVKKEISVPPESKISMGAETKALADLKVGDKLTVEYTYDVATGKRTAQAITIGEAAPAPATP